MSEIISLIFELIIFVSILWMLVFLSVFLHEAGHALGYRIVTEDRDWHIRVGSGKKLLNTRKLTVKLLPFDGCFMPSEKNMTDTAAKRIAMLSGGPAVSLILTAALLAVRLGGMSLHSEIITADAIEFFIRAALFINLFILIQSLIPAHYFYGELKGMETDGLQIIKIIRSYTSKS